MYPIPDEFLAALRHNHTLLITAEFWYGGEQGAEAPIIGGDVTVDRTASIRRSGVFSFSASDQDIVLPAVDNYFESPLWPIGNEVKVFASIVGVNERCPLGVFRISRPRLHHEEGNLSVSVDGYDRAKAISRARFTNIYAIAAGLDYATAIKTLLQNRMPTLSDTDFRFMKTDGSDGGPVYVTPNLLFDLMDDPWVRAEDMARSLGAELFFTPEGLPTLRPQPDPAFSPSVFDYIAGEEATFTSLDRELDEELAYNGLIVTGKNNDNATILPRGEAWDTNPNSPTYYDPLRPDLSTYGAVPEFMTSDFITSNPQAQAMADGNLLTHIGIMEQISFDGIANPAHEGSDVVAVKDDVIGVDGMYLLESFKLGLGEGGGMNGSTRKRRIL